MEKMNKLKNIIAILKNILTKNIYLKIISFLIAVIGWFIVVWSIDPDVTTVLKNVPIQIGTSEALSMQKIGLNIIDGNNIFATVRIKGNRNVIGAIKNDDISVTASTVNIVEAGIYELEVSASTKNQIYKDIKFSAINPSVIKVKVDKVVTKVVPIEVICNGVVVPDGYMLEKAVPSVNELTITGPEKDVEKVDKGVVICNINKKIDKTLKVVEDVILRGNDLIDIDTKYINLDSEVINITIPVLKKKVLPVTIDFINKPKEFPIDELKYFIEPKEIEVAGPSDDIDKRESINVAYIDMKDLNLEQQEEYSINIPSNFVNIENVEKVKVSFNMENMDSKEILNVIVKMPYTLATHNVVVNSKNLNKVTVIGKKSIISKLTSGDIVAEIEINDSEITTGQMSVPLKISIPNKGLVWAIGDYRAIITITDKK